MPKAETETIGAGTPAHNSHQETELGLLLVVVVFVPVALGVPAVLVFIPPAMMLTPATFPHFVQFAAFVIGLAAVAAVAFNSLVKFMLGVSDATLTAVDVFSVQHWSEEEDRAQNRA